MRHSFGRYLIYLTKRASLIYGIWFVPADYLLSMPMHTQVLATLGYIALQMHQTGLYYEWLHALILNSVPTHKDRACTALSAMLSRHGLLAILCSIPGRSILFPLLAWLLGAVGVIHDRIAHSATVMPLLFCCSSI